MRPVLAISCLGLLLATALSTRADIARPKPAPSPTENKFIYSSLQIVPDAKANNALLQIRQSDLKELTVALNGVSSSKPLAASITQSGPRTIVAGLLLFASLSFAGVWLARAARSGSGVGRGQKTMAIVVVAVATIGAAAIITRGNAVHHRPTRGETCLPHSRKDAQREDKIIEVVPDDQLPNGGMKLTIPLKNRTPKAKKSKSCKTHCKSK